MAVMERRSPTRPGCARTPTAGSTSASTTGRSRSGARSARASDRLLSALRAPAVAGRFYPGAGGELEDVVRGLLDEAAPAPPAVAAVARAAVAPHAAYVYSGLTAAHVFARLAVPPVVVILGPNHSGVCHAPGGVSLWAAGAFRTPLGDVVVDERFGARLVAACDLVAPDPDAHRAEHAVEVEVPFLQLRRPGVRIVPLVLAWDEWRSEEHTSELQSQSNLVCRLLLEKKNN